jgi:hypothetical protein
VTFLNACIENESRLTERKAMAAPGEHMTKDRPCPRDAMTAAPRSTGRVAPPAVDEGGVKRARHAPDIRGYYHVPMVPGRGRDTGAARSAIVAIPRVDGPPGTAAVEIGRESAAAGAHAPCHAPVETAEIVA